MMVLLCIMIQKTWVFLARESISSLSQSLMRKSLAGQIALILASFDDLRDGTDNRPSFQQGNEEQNHKQYQQPFSLGRPARAAIHSLATFLLRYAHLLRVFPKKKTASQNLKVSACAMRILLTYILTWHFDCCLRSIQARPKHFLMFRDNSRARVVSLAVLPRNYFSRSFISPTLKKILSGIEWGGRGSSKFKFALTHIGRWDKRSNSIWTDMVMERICSSVYHGMVSLEHFWAGKYSTSFPFISESGML